VLIPSEEHLEDRRAAIIMIAPSILPEGAFLIIEEVHL